LSVTAWVPPLGRLHVHPAWVSLVSALRWRSCR
jgi:hypothetical protein